MAFFVGDGAGFQTNSRNLWQDDWLELSIESSNSEQEEDVESLLEFVSSELSNVALFNGEWSEGSANDIWFRGPVGQGNVGVDFKSALSLDNLGDVVVVEEVEGELSSSGDFHGALGDSDDWV